VRIILDLDVLLDIIMNRQPHYRDSARTISEAFSPNLEVLIPSHSATTLYYLVAKGASRRAADRAVDWLLTSFHVVPTDREVLLHARKLGMNDFEDAVVAVQAEKAGCDFIITRNVTDYRNAPVKAITPREFLDLLATGM
jgi:predicted nucleic acid-binding protein